MAMTIICGVGDNDWAPPVRMASRRMVTGLMEGFVSPTRGAREDHQSIVLVRNGRTSRHLSSRASCSSWPPAPDFGRAVDTPLSSAQRVWFV